MQHLAREVRHRLLVEQAVVALTGLSPWIGACLLLSVPGTVLLSGRCPAAWLMVAGVAL